MNPGDRVEAALWYNADQPGERGRAVEGVRKALDGIAAQQMVTIGAPEFEDLAPDDRRLTHEPPAHFTGSPKVLLATARVETVLSRPTPLSEDLERADLERLRAVTRRHRPGLTDEECDAIIDRLGPESAARAIRETVH